MRYKYPPLFVYSRAYYLDLGFHVFPAVKFNFLYKRLRSDERFASKFGQMFKVPRKASYQDLALVHSDYYLKDLKELRDTARTRSSELPLTKQIVEAFRKASGGTILAGKLALQYGMAMNLSGGFHHAFADKAEGFCYLNDVAVAVRLLIKKKLIKKVAIIDLDVHQGNGNALIFQDDDNVFTFSMHQQDLYPAKQKSDLDIGLEKGIMDSEYLNLLHQALSGPIEKFKPQMVFYLAGADPYEDDQLGSLKLTKAGLQRRDRIVKDYCYFNQIPVAVVLAGGYAYNNEDTIDIHFRTALTFANFA